MATTSPVDTLIAEVEAAISELATRIAAEQANPDAATTAAVAAIASRLSSYVPTLDTYITAAKQELAIRKATELADPTTTNADAVSNVEARIKKLQQALSDANNALAQPQVNPVTVYTPLPISPVITGVTSTGGSVPPVTTTPVITPVTTPVINPTTGGTTGTYGPPPPTTTTTTTTPPVINPTTGGVAGGTYGPLPPPDFLGEVVPTYVLNGIPAVVAPAGVPDAWNYFRDTIDSSFTDLESAFESIGTGTVTGGTDVAITEIGLGVTADVAGIDVIAFAGALLLSEYIGGWIIEKVGEYFPNPSVFGWYPLNFIQKGIERLGKQFEQSASGLGQPLIDLFTSPIRQILGLFQRSGNATASAHNKIAKVVTETIPAAASTAVTTSNAYSDQLRHDIETAVAQAMTTVGNITSGTDAKLIVAQANQTGGLVWDFTGLVAAGIAAADEYARTHAGDVTGAIATAVASVTNDVTKLVTSFETDLVKRLTGDETALATLATTVTTTVPNEIATKVNQATATENQALTAQITTLENQITTLQGQQTVAETKLEAYQQAVQAAADNITALQGSEVVDAQAIQQQQQIIATAQAGIATATQSIADLQTQITGISSTLAPIHAAQQLNTLQLAPFEAIGAVALPTLLATLTTTLRQVKNKVDTCAVTTCDPNSPQNIKHVLRDMLGLLSAAGEIGFIAEAIRDPQGTANALSPFLDGIDNQAVSLLDTLLSL